MKGVIAVDGKVLYNAKNIEYARQLRKDMTKQERKLWYEYLKKSNYKWYKQRRIGNYIVDFYCDKLRLVLEIDGSQHYEEEQKEYDKARTKMLNACGISVLRIANNKIDDNFLGVCEYIDIVIGKILANSLEETSQAPTAPALLKGEPLGMRYD